MQGYALGNDATAATVLRMGEINLDGNVIPHSWYEHLRYPNGKPNLNAIVILAEVVYWYRPIVLKDEKTGRVLPARKKFEGEHLQRTRKSFAEQFGLTTKQVKDALNFLEEKKVVEVIIAKSLKIANGKKLGNVPYIALDAEKVAEFNRPLVPVSPSLGTCKSEPSVHRSPTNTETTYTETINTKRPLRANDARAEPPQASLPDTLSLDELGEIFADEFERITDSLEGEQQKQVVYAQESLLNDSPPGKDVSVIRASSYSAPVAPRATAKGKQSNPNTKPILDAYFSLLTYKPTNAAKEAKAAKALADDGYTPEQVSAAYRRMKSETFWQLKHLSLAKVHENIGALLPALSPPGNGQRVSSRDGYTFLNV